MTLDYIISPERTFGSFIISDLAEEKAVSTLPR